MGDKIRIGALISGGGTNLQAIIDSCESGKIEGEMVFVGTDNPDAKGLGRASKHNIPTFVVDYSSIIKKYGKEPGKIRPPGDFDMKDILSRLSLFPAGTDSKKTETFVVTRATAEAELLEKMKPYLL